MHRVAVHDLARAVRGEMQMGVAVPEREMRVGCAVVRAERARDVLLVLAVEGLDAVGAVTGAGQRVGEQVAATTHGAVGVVAAEATAAARQLHARTAGARSREELDDAGHRVGAIEHARWAAHDLDAIEVVGAERGEVECAAGVVHRHAVDEHLGELALAAANEQRGRAAVRAGLHDGHAGHLAQRVGHGGDAFTPQLLARDDRYRRGRSARRERRARRGDEHGRDARRVLRNLRGCESGRCDERKERERRSGVHG